VACARPQIASPQDCFVPIRLREASNCAMTSSAILFAVRDYTHIFQNRFPTCETLRNHQLWGCEDNIHCLLAHRHLPKAVKLQGIADGGQFVCQENGSRNAL
jgi:hypothetical protein